MFFFLFLLSLHSYPEAIFDIDYFAKDARPFFLLARELFPGRCKPSDTHFFIRLLHEKGLLLRVFTQNIDCLERVSGLPESMIVEAHGSFHSATCLSCRKHVSKEVVRSAIFSDPPSIPPLCPHCHDGIVKPDIVFFGEPMPEIFFEQSALDFPSADLLIVLGTSLQVFPFALLVNKVRNHAPRLFVNRDPPPSSCDEDCFDVVMQGDCDRQVNAILFSSSCWWFHLPPSHFFSDLRF